VKGRLIAVLFAFERDPVLAGLVALEGTVVAAVGLEVHEDSGEEVRGRSPSRSPGTYTPFACSRCGRARQVRTLPGLA
jgi:hypothetical protein